MTADTASMKQTAGPSFGSDYMGGAHPRVLEALTETNALRTPGYGTDSFCQEAAALIRQACRCPQAEVRFLVGGTQTNLVALSALLAPYQGVVAADTGHINGHEAGAIERGGHKVLALPARDGKITAKAIEACWNAWEQDETRDHVVMPGAVYLSQPTESGTLYSLADLAALCDAFYIGGTKCGALFGEALVFPKPEQIPHFFSLMKQSGAVLAKGRLLGVQFKALFTDGLYEEIGRQALAQAARLREGLRALGYEPLGASPTNQVFVRIPAALYHQLIAEGLGGFWSVEPEDAYIIRFVTDWSTREDEIRRLLDRLEKAR